MRNINISLIFIFCSLVFWVERLPAQDSSYVAYEDDSYKLEIIIQHDTIYIQDSVFVSHLNDVTRRFNMSFDEYSKKLLEAVEQHDSTSITSLERIYLNYLLPMYYPSYIEHRYIARNYSVEIKDNFMKMDIQNIRLPISVCRDSLKMDIMVVFRGDVNTDNFLKSEFYRASCLEQLFWHIYKSKITNIEGVNFYFPDFSFKQKRAMAQFIKSASLVMDSCHVEKIRDLKLYATFDKDIGGSHKEFLYGLTQMADSVLLVNSKTESWMRDSVIVLDKEDSKNISWLGKVYNQFYFARFQLNSFPVSQEDELSLQSLRDLINSDYSYNTWEGYFFALIIIFIVIIAIFILYWTIPRFSYFLNNNMTYLYSMIIMLILEIYLLFVCMIESMSKEDVFTFGGENRNTFLLFPLLFIFIVPMLNRIGKRREKP